MTDSTGVVCRQSGSPGQAMRPGSIAALALLLGVLGFALGMSSVSESGIGAAGTHQLDRLYFGRSMNCGGTVSDAQWNSFVTHVVTPRLPAGFTVWHADGQWRDDDGRVLREPTFVLEVLHTAGAGSTTAVATIIDTYKHDFCQQSVLWVRDWVDVRG